MVSAIKKEFPPAKIDALLGTPATRKIVELFPEINIRDVADVAAGPAGMIAAVVKTWHVRYDALIFTCGVDSAKAAMLAKLVRAERKLFLYNPGSGRGAEREVELSIHRLENNLKFLSMMGIKMPDPPRAYMPIDNSPAAVPGSVMIHPGSDPSNPYKRWPAEKFAEVAARLLDAGREVAVMLGPGESELGKHFATLEGWSGFKICAGMSMKDALREIAARETLLNSDSGLGHIAAALGRRVVTIIGPGNPVTIRPYGSNVVVIKTPRDVECSPCIQSGGRYGCGERDCLSDIEVGEVAKIVDGGDSEYIWRPGSRRSDD